MIKFLLKRDKTLLFFVLLLIISIGIKKLLDHKDFEAVTNTYLLKLIFVTVTFLLKIFVIFKISYILRLYSFSLNHYRFVCLIQEVNFIIVDLVIVNKYFLIYKIPLLFLIILFKEKLIKVGRENANFYRKLKGLLDSTFTIDNPNISYVPYKILEDIIILFLSMCCLVINYNCSGKYMQILSCDKTLVYGIIRLIRKKYEFVSSLESQKGKIVIKKGTKTVTTKDFDSIEVINGEESEFYDVKQLEITDEMFLETNFYKIIEDNGFKNFINENFPNLRLKNKVQNNEKFSTGERKILSLIFSFQNKLVYFINPENHLSKQAYKEFSKILENSHKTILIKIFK